MIQYSGYRPEIETVLVKNGAVWLYYKTDQSNSNFVFFTKDEWERIQNKVTLAKLEEQFSNETN